MFSDKKKIEYLNNRIQYLEERLRAFQEIDTDDLERLITAWERKGKPVDPDKLEEMLDVARFLSHTVTAGEQLMEEHVDRDRQIDGHDASIEFLREKIKAEQEMRDKQMAQKEKVETLLHLLRRPIPGS